MSKIRLYALTITILSVIITEALSDGQVVLLKVPNSIKFLGNEPLKGNSFKCMILALSNLPINSKCLSWSGLKIINPFNLPKSVLFIRMKNNKGYPIYNFHYDGKFEDLKEDMNSEIDKHRSDGLSLSYKNLIKNEKSEDWVSAPYDLIIGIIDKKIENRKINVRHKRETESTSTSTKSILESLNLADDYDENFPVIFNIILWFSVALLFSLIAISMVIGSMDPGRDSIIYRMTSTRMKKDN